MASESWLEQFFPYLAQHLEETRDHVVSEWSLMDNPNIVLCIATGYLIFCKYIGPFLMKNRRPYSLKNTILVYNAIQILACIYFSYTIVNEGLYVLTTLNCDPEKFYHPRIPEVIYQLMFLKMLELIETVFFILRKKQSQVTGLHLYHHSTTFLFCWLALKYRGGLGMSTFALLNCLVHILMYTYYTIAALGSPEVQRAIQGFKRYITIIQMIQFTIVLILIARYVLSGCVKGGILALLFFPNVIIVFYMFYDFYNSTYNKKNK
ncbi:elongation of very long chain fatty acids protein [Nesidiocoris tenuis]|uniref:Elongation of very long chain fatty acids protein n=1 Tax=Nesidiocoris tenuis TaxID=355587 RepID=A0ABN7AH41_9HEMI|nr:elongation of very long chain fatty acids protein [Nesidiocoris tenuis]